MSIDEHQRYQLHQALETHLGPDAAATLMAYLPPVGWADVATKRDLNALEQRLELRFEASDHRFAAALSDVRTEIAEVRTEIHTTARTTTIAIVGATTAIVTAIAAIAAITNLFG